MGNLNSYFGKKNDEFKVLSEENIKFLIENTAFDREHIIEWHRGFFDDYPNGRMGKKQFINFFSQRYPKKKGEKFCEVLFKLFDVDHNRCLNFEEFMIAITITSIGDDIDNKLKLIFKLYQAGKQTDLIERNQMIKIVNGIYTLSDNYNEKNTYVDHCWDECCYKENDADLIDRYSSSQFVDSIMRNSPSFTNDFNSLPMEEFIQACLNDPLIRDLLSAYL